MYTQKGQFPYLAGETDIALVVRVRDGGYSIIAGNFRVGTGMTQQKGGTSFTSRTHIEDPTPVLPSQYRAHFQDIEKKVFSLARSIRDFAVEEN